MKRWRICGAAWRLNLHDDSGVAPALLESFTHAFRGCSETAASSPPLGQSFISPYLLLLCFSLYVVKWSNVLFRSSFLSKKP